MRNRTLKYASLVISVFIAVLASGISGCLPDPYTVGEPDSLFSEFVLVWDLMDSHYACFFAKENVNWDEVYQRLKPEAENLSNRDQLIDLCLEMLSELEDQNLILRNSDGTRLDSWSQDDFLNWDLSVWTDYMNCWVFPDTIDGMDIYDALVINITPDDSIAYIYVNDLGDEFSIYSFFSVTDIIENCSGAILDIRMCRESGKEVNAGYACGRFVDKAALSFYRVFRTGPGRNDMGEMLPVIANRNGAWQFTGPIILLTGRDTQGAGEQLVLLLRTQEHITVIGDTTAGFANPPVSFDLTEGYTIEIPEMVTYSLDSTLILNSGIAPDILIQTSEADFAAGVDPVIDAAIEMLTQQ